MATSIGFVSAAKRPEKSQLVGYGLGLLALGGAWVLAQSQPGPFHPATFLLVLLGAAATLLLNSTAAELGVWGVRLPSTNLDWIKQRLVELATVSRTSGARGLERELIGVTDPLERQALLVLSAGGGPLEVETAMRRVGTEAEAQAQAPERLWRALGQGAINAGALISTLTMLAVLRGPNTALPTQALAGCLSAAVYGLCVGHVVCGPQALRSRRLAEQARVARALWLEGFVAVASGVHPRLLAERMGLDELTPATALRRVA